MSQGARIIKTNTSQMHPCVAAFWGFTWLSQSLTRKSDTPVNGT